MEVEVAETMPGSGPRFLDHAKNKEFDKVMKLVKENAGYVTGLSSESPHFAPHLSAPKQSSFRITKKGSGCKATLEACRSMPSRQAAGRRCIRRPRQLWVRFLVVRGGGSRVADSAGRKVSR